MEKQLLSQKKMAKNIHLIKNQHNCNMQKYGIYLQWGKSGNPTNN